MLTYGRHVKYGMEEVLSRNFSRSKSWVMDHQSVVQSGRGGLPQVCRKCAVRFDPMCAKSLLFNTELERFRAGLIVGKLSYERGCQEKNSPPPPRGDVDVVICIQPILPS